jgi:hypothetical protein
MRSQKSNSPIRPPIVPKITRLPATSDLAQPLPRAAAHAVPIAPRPVARGAPGLGNPRKRQSYGNAAPPEKRARTAPVQVEASGPSHDPVFAQMTAVHASELLKLLEPPKAQSGREAYSEYEAHLLLRIGQVHAPKVVKKVDGLCARLRNEFAAHPGAQGHVLNSIDITVSADELRYRRIPDPSPQGLYRAALRQFHFQKLQQAMGKDPAFTSVSPVTQAELRFIVSSVFNVTMGLGFFDFEKHNPQELQAGVDKAVGLGLGLVKIASHISDADPSAFFAFASQEGSALKDFFFPESAGQALTAPQQRQMLAALTLGRPQGEIAHDYRDWFAQQAIKDGLRISAPPPEAACA